MLLVLLPVLFILILKPCRALAASIDHYEIYEPTVERYFVHDVTHGKYKYNHDASVAWFKGCWYAVWNANTNPHEGRSGQVNVLSTSLDFKHWSDPVEVFNDPLYSENPVSAEGALQWQPNLIVVDDELWCVWSQNGGAVPGTYVSKLKSPGGRWTNKRLLFPSEQGMTPDPVINGHRWRLFPTQNPVRLRSGRVLAPVIAMGPPVADPPRDLAGWWTQAKLNAVLITDDGEDWHLSQGTTQAHKPWAVWEPTVWELRDGTVMMFCRNNDPREEEAGGDPAFRMLLYAVSTDQGETWSDCRPVPLETVSSRMHVLALDEARFVMVHNDYRKEGFVRDRLNFALYFSRRGSLDFLPGIGFSGRETVVAYPQMFIHDGAFHVIYSQGNVPRSIKAARIWPLPKSNQYYILPRSNWLSVSEPQQLADGLLFAGNDCLQVNWDNDSPAASLRLAFELQPHGAGALLDSRYGTGRGFVVLLVMDDNGCVCPAVNLGTPEGNLCSSLKLPLGHLSSFAVAIDLKRNTASFEAGGQREDLPFTGQVALGANRLAIGNKALAVSRLSGFSGVLRSVTLTSEGPGDDLKLDFLPQGGWERHRKPQPPSPMVQKSQYKGEPVLEICGEASAGLELPEHFLPAGAKVEFGFCFRLDFSPGYRVLTTIGYADAPVRIVAEDDSLWLVSSMDRQYLGQACLQDWTALKVSVSGGRLQAALDGEKPGACPYNADYVLAYLGQGYLQGTVVPGAGFMVLISSVYSRVI